MAKKKTEAKAPESQPLTLATIKPEELKIIGLDEGFRNGEPEYFAELDDPDRLTAPTKDYVANLIAKGHPKPVQAMRRNGFLVVVDGRQHVMGARIANKMIGDKAPAIEVPYFLCETASALDVARANEWARRDTPLQKARRAARMIALGHTKEEVMAAFSDDGCNAITRTTIRNWLRAANCCAELQGMFTQGAIPITVLYELGKIGGPEDAPEQKTKKQLAALAKLGTLSGAAAREEASEAVEEVESEKEDSGEKKPREPKGKSLRLPDKILNRLAERFEDDDEDPFTDSSDSEHPYEYQDGDIQAVTSALLAFIVGDDPSAKSLERFPSVYKFVKKYARSEAA